MLGVESQGLWREVLEYGSWRNMKVINTIIRMNHGGGKLFAISAKLQ